MKTKGALRLGVLSLFCAGVLMAPGSAFAYRACTETYAGDCLAGTHCDFYDDETDQWYGSITVEYQCP